MRNKTMICAMVIVMACSVVCGGLLVNWCNAESDGVVVEPSTEIVEPEELPTVDEPEEPQTADEPTVETEQVTKAPTHEDIILRDSGLATIDYMKLIDKSKNHNWYAYYIHSDGDLYVVTIRNDRVDVCCILN